MKTVVFVKPRREGSAVVFAALFAGKRRVDILQFDAGDFVAREKTSRDSARLIAGPVVEYGAAWRAAARALRGGA